MALGIFIFLEPIAYDYKYGMYVNLSGYNKPFGIAFVVVGLIFVRWSFDKKYQTARNIVQICPKCEEPPVLTGPSGMRCPKCGAELEPVKGFYERHPECRATGESEKREQDR